MDQVVPVGSDPDTGSGYNVLLDHGAAQIVGAEAQSDLSQLEPLGDPRGLDVRDVDEIEPGYGQSHEVVDARSLFGDLLRGKSGGMVILANGKPGVGKTLTAEVFAEHTKRPLYVMEMGELGTNLASVEQNLQRVFLRATRWNAVLLMDEADIFMHKRDDNLERSAIVGVFLRLLDYYHGLFFLTSNRAEVIDPAFKSRITLQLDYPDLDRDARLKIWDLMFKMANIEVTDGLDGLPDIELNGRQIRNLVRLVKVMNPGGKVTSEKVKEICRFACK